MEDAKKAILVVSFGTSYKDTREKTIDAIENHIKDTFPEYKIYRAFTSNMIIKKLIKEYHIKVDTVTEALERLIRDGINEVIVQPTHIINGIENDEMLKDIHKYRSHFISIKIGTPLLTSIEDYNDIIKIITKEFSYMTSDEALVCMGHGSSHYTNSTYPALDYMFKEKGYNNIFIGTVEAYPSFETVERELKRVNFRRVILMPLMVVAGDHALNDMAGDEEDSWKSILELQGFKVDCVVKGLGEYPEIRQMYIKHIQKAIK